ncbi:MAG: response regulator [Pseudomonadota bacterium]
MRVLIVQSNPGLSNLWARHLKRLGARVDQASTAHDALAVLQTDQFDVIVLDLVLREGSALTVADFANFSMPRANVVFVTDTTFFSDGSIFAHSANARAFLKTGTPPADLAEIVCHYGGDPVAETSTPPKPRESSRPMTA